MYYTIVLSISRNFDRAEKFIFTVGYEKSAKLFFWVKEFK
jgi:hypothetical protein